MLRTRLSLPIALFLSICLIFPIVASDEIDMNNGSPEEKFLDTSLMPVNVSNLTNETVNLATPDELEVTLGLKGPKDHVTFAPENPVTNSVYDVGAPYMNISQNSTEEIPGNISADNSSPAQNLSLGDIIKAKDWKALGEYNCKIRAENSELLKDTEIGSSDKQAKWDSYFNPPEPVIYYPCCNG